MRWFGRENVKKALKLGSGTSFLGGFELTQLNEQAASANQLDPTVWSSKADKVCWLGVAIVIYSPRNARLLPIIESLFEWKTAVKKSASIASLNMMHLRVKVDA